MYQLVQKKLVEKKITHWHPGPLSSVSRVPTLVVVVAVVVAVELWWCWCCCTVVAVVVVVVVVDVKTAWLIMFAHVNKVTLMSTEPAWPS